MDSIPLHPKKEKKVILIQNKYTSKRFRECSRLCGGDLFNFVVAALQPADGADGNREGAVPEFL
jgi:hypothetical protein